MTQFATAGFHCRICGGEHLAASYRVREMYLGTREVFPYHECGRCGCLQIAAVPEDPGRFYPANYYSKAPGRKAGKPGRLFAYLNEKRLRHHLDEPNPLGALLCSLAGRPRLPYWLRRRHLKADDRILDVGCGTGKRLLKLREKGFLHLTGVDPHIDASIRYANGVEVRKCTLDEIEGCFDFIMLHHSLEHIPEQKETMEAVFRLLRTGRCALVRIPLASSYAFRHYRENWVQLDAPRHLYLHSESSLKLLAERTGFRVADVVYDSSALQFIGSERYLRDIPLAAADGRAQKVGAKSLFDAGQLQRYRAQAEELNARGDGDQACFLLHKSV